MDKGRKQQRQKEAQERRIAYAQRSPEEQLALVKLRPGKSTKETKYLQQLIAAKKQK